MKKVLVLIFSLAIALPTFAQEKEKKKIKIGKTKEEKVDKIIVQTLETIDFSKGCKNQYRYGWAIG